MIVECPRGSWTTFAGTPAASMSDAALCRRSCSRIGGSFAAATRAWNRSVTVAGCRAEGSAPASVDSLPVRPRPRWKESTEPWAVPDLVDHELHRDLLLRRTEPSPTFLMRLLRSDSSPAGCAGAEG